MEARFRLQIQVTEDYCPTDKNSQSIEQMPIARVKTPRNCKIFDLERKKRERQFQFICESS